MATWRRKAWELFPSLHRDIQDPTYTYYMLFFDLLPMVREAHATGDTNLLTNIYLFAAWCLQQRRAPDLYNAVCVAFYEHLFDHRNLWDAVFPWLTPEVIDACRPLWEARLKAEEWREIQYYLRQ